MYINNKINNFFFLIFFWIVLFTTVFLGIIIFLDRSVYSKKQLKLKETVKAKNKVLYLENFPEQNAGYQYRSLKWKRILENNGFNVAIKTILPEKPRFDHLVKNQFTLFLITCVFKRLCQIVGSARYDTVIVRRELLLFNDYGNLFMEKFLLRIHPNVILDFDDDIAASKREPREIKSLYGKLMLENGNKFNDSLRLYKRFIVASNYLKEKVLRENPKINPDSILVIPTCVDYDKYEPKVYDLQKPIITLGWIGGNQNQSYLKNIIPALNKLSEKYPIELKVISGKSFTAETNFPIINAPWSLEDEVEQLKTIDVGLMPLPLNDRTKGKGGFKLIQYMGLGIVSVASAISINKEIVENGVNGFLVEPGEDWTEALYNIIKQKTQFKQIGQKARKTILKSYTFEANKSQYINFLNAK